MQSLVEMFLKQGENPTSAEDLKREFGSDNCFSVSSFLTFNLVLASTIVNVVSNLNNNNGDNNDNNNNNNNLNANINGQGRSSMSNMSPH